MGKLILLLALLAVACLYLPSSAIAQPRTPQEGIGTDQYVEPGSTTDDGLAALAHLGINGPEDFDYCDEQGCHLLGPSNKEFFVCDPSWNCKYVLWGSYELGPDDFDYLEVEASDPAYGEVGSCYACGPTEVCLNVASYDCDAAGNCVYHMDERQHGGLEDAVPEASESARQALEGFSEALANAPAAKTRSTLAAEVDPSEVAASEGDVARGGEVAQSNKMEPNGSSGSGVGNTTGDATSSGGSGGESDGNSSETQSSANESDPVSGGDSGGASGSGSGVDSVLSAAGVLYRNPGLPMLGAVVVLAWGMVLLFRTYR